MLTEEMMDELVLGLRNILKDNILQIILYGSVARNEETDFSDIDIAMVLDHKLDVETRYKFLSWAADMDLKFDRVFSIIDIEKDNLDKWGRVLPFYRNIREQGVLLWKAA